MKGVGQWNSISPKLFPATLEGILKNTELEQFRILKMGVQIHHLRFTDNIVLFSETTDNGQEIINLLSKESVEIDLQMKKWQQD